MKIEHSKIHGFDEKLKHLHQQTTQLDAAIQKAENIAEEIIRKKQYETKELLKIGFLAITVVAAHATVKAAFEFVSSK